MISTYYPGIVVAKFVILDQFCLHQMNSIVHFIIAVISTFCRLLIVLGHRGGAIKLHQWRYDFGYQ